MIIRRLHPALESAMRDGAIIFHAFKHGRDDKSTSIHCIINPMVVRAAFPELEGLPDVVLSNPDKVDPVVLRIGMGNVHMSNQAFQMDGARLIDLDVIRAAGIGGNHFVVATRAVFGQGKTPEERAANAVTFTGDGR